MLGTTATGAGAAVCSGAFGWTLRAYTGRGGSLREALRGAVVTEIVALLMGGTSLVCGAVGRVQDARRPFSFLALRSLRLRGSKPLGMRGAYRLPKPIRCGAPIS